MPWAVDAWAWYTGQYENSCVITSKYTTCKWSTRHNLLVTLESNKELCKWWESDEVLKHGADVATVIGIVIRSWHDVITDATRHRVFTAQMLQYSTVQMTLAHTQTNTHTAAFTRLTLLCYLSQRFVWNCWNNCVIDFIKDIRCYSLL